MKKFLLANCCLFTFFMAYSQEDSAQLKTLDEVVITATRTERKLSNVAVPVQLISQKIIRQSGSIRLNDILQEQTGLFVTSGGTTSTTGGGIFGNGVQIQGLSPDYTLILIDGEPVIGRQGGVIDLARIAVGNIKKIEVVKGPSSSLYGSEAMGGVINIITQQARERRLDAGVRYGRFNSLDANISTGFTTDKIGLQFFANRNHSDGYDLDPAVVGKTVDTYNNHTAQLRFKFQYSLKTKFNLSARYYNEIQDNFFEISDITTGSRVNIVGDARVRDLGLNPVITHQFSDKIKSAVHIFLSRYEYEQDLIQESNKSDYYYDFFQQHFFRVENQTDFTWLNNNYLSFGGGLVKERLNTTRYDGKRKNNINYVFAQNEWRIKNRMTVIGGLRFDNNSEYQSRLSPKLAAQYKVTEKLRFNTSYGGGFKAPDFRQLFLNFLNTAAGGYVVYGANEITIDELKIQQQHGIVTDILPRAYQLNLLKPEISNGFNFGANYDLTEKVNLSLNLFRNNIKNLIQNDIIAFRQNNAPVYSYFNVKDAFTQGAEFQSQLILNKYFIIHAGYQFLMTGDKDDLERIKNGTVYTRDQHTNVVTRVSRRDYGGLSNRSSHMLNAKLFYENSKKNSGASIRAIYRNRWGTYDKDGNNIINRDDEFAKGFLLLNISMQKSIKYLRMQVGADNILNYKDVLNLPGQPGIQPYISIAYSFNKNYQTL